ncbi:MULTISPECIES: efflux RND transporter periplasmic adaptor subunit [unclassified Caulobacter]|jgi:cobalt-zinc-cadmium efflux system membrane fusion protein|uniref:efflux RND transporter periplasmic adaptor subunit n=1 Tax=unclassified Caulobacter TaxID=2648921 RepID=UPI00078559C4|nr:MULTISPECIES: efflux RND transporter periplasmic adaptor subunit [unclassified Caulobacter]AZS21789.1 efflux RND transporter periplasmic adaptor subunit [Caulobacter sp. FWC26]
MKSNDRKTLLTAVAVSAVLAAGAGVLIGKTMLSSPAKDAPAAEAKEDHAGEKPHVAMTAERIAADGIQLVTLAGGGLDAAVPAQATVVATPNGAAILAARADGAIVRINKRLGDPVAAGEVIAAIESRDAAAISADRSAAAAKAAAARQALVREQRLFEAKITARQDLEAAQREAAIAESELRRASGASAAAGVSGNGRTLAVTSPISGRITAATATLGAYVAAGSELFRVADPGRIEIQAALPVADAQRVKPGDAAVVETASGSVNATVRSITPALDAENRSATAVLAVSGEAPMLTPGQALRARITPRGAAASVSGRISAPDEAVQTVNGAEVVFVRTKNGFEPRPVRVGRRGGGQVEILSGVRTGEQIAGKGAFLLKAELGKGEASHED